MKENKKKVIFICKTTFRYSMTLQYLDRRTIFRPPPDVKRLVFRQMVNNRRSDRRSEKSTAASIQERLLFLIFF